MIAARAAASTIAALAAVTAAACTAEPDRWAPASTAAPTSPVLAWPPAAPTARFGRGVAPARGAAAPLVGGPRRARVTPVADSDPALAVVAGGAVTMLVEVDTGTVRWRDDTARCSGGVRRADRVGIVCAAARGTAGWRADGAPWADPRPLVFVDAAVALVADGGAAVPIDRATGVAGAPIALPAGVDPARIVARCDDELWVAGDGVLRRLVPGRAGFVASWAAPIGELRGVSACDPIVLAEIAPPAAAPPPPPPPPPPPVAARGRHRRPPPRHAPPVEAAPTSVTDPPWPVPIATVDRAAPLALLALDRATGRRLSAPVRARGVSSGPGGAEVELATAAGLERRRRDLAPGRVVPGSPVVGALLDRRGARTLWAGPPSGDGPATVYVLDAAGVRAVLAAPGASGALGVDHVLVAGAGPALRVALPDARPARLPPAPTEPPRPPVGRAALPPPSTPRALARPTGGPLGSVIQLAIDPRDPARLVALTEDAGAATAVEIDLRAGTARPLPEACAAGVPTAVAIAGANVVCATADGEVARVVATGRDGVAWRWTGAAAQAVTVAGDAVAVIDDAAVRVLAASTGELLLARARDPAAAVAPVLVASGGDAALVDDEAGALVLRPVRAPLGPAWATAVAGQLTQLAPIGGDLFALLDGADPYRVDLAGGGASALAAAADTWTVAGDLVIGLARDPAPGDAPGYAVRGFAATGERFRTGLGASAGCVASPTRAADAAAPVVIACGDPDGPRAIALDPTTGIPRAVAALPAGPVAVFATVVDGQPVAGAVVFGTLTVLTF